MASADLTAATCAKSAGPLLRCIGLPTGERAGSHTPHVQRCVLRICRDASQAPVHGEEGAAGPLQRLCEGDRLRLALVEEADLAKHGHREPVRKRGHHPEHPLAASSVGAQKGAVVA